MTEKAPDITVFISSRSSVCSDCGEDLGRSAWITLTEDKKSICLGCADLDHLAFLPSGDAALTRRSKKHSGLCAVVVKWSRARKRYERQGLLVEENAFRKAEDECAADETERESRRQASRDRAARFEVEYIERFARAILEEFPGCPETSAQSIARHACLKHSGRVGRSAEAKALQSKTIQLAVIAHIRHEKTRYDELLMNGHERDAARQTVASDVERIFETWRKRL